ncbi:Smr/MutS family protein [Candidatus Peregrinibacteria bacterium]|nr:Smr/MutS family protein [Candidatus Peregrinibacteria bacterium]
MGKSNPETGHREESESTDENGIRNLDHLNEADLYEQLTGERPDSKTDLSSLRALEEKESEPEEKMTLGERLKKYPSKPQRDLDLHGKKGEEAGRAVRLFLLEAERQNLRKVRIITGKGLHSEEGQSVLKTVTEAKIKELKDEGRILASEWDGKSRTSSGAVIVYLV